MSDGFPYPDEKTPGNFAYRKPAGDEIESAGMLADRLRQLVLAGDDACISGTPMVPIHKATLTSIVLALDVAREGRK